MKPTWKGADDDQGRGFLIPCPRSSPSASARPDCGEFSTSTEVIPTILVIPTWRCLSWPLILKVVEGKRNTSRFNTSEVAYRMSKMETMSSVLVDHNWTSIEEWVCALCDLADLDDQALDEIESMHSRQGNGTAS